MNGMAWPGRLAGAGLKGLFLALCLAGASANGARAAAETVTVTGEVVDTWCYLSGVMGGPDAAVG